jgi:tetratricopeptide (TPR) repeat protein
MRRIPGLLLLFVLSAVLAPAETRVGTVTSVIGSVSIDAFGKGAFIPAAKGDPLYASTILKTGANGRAVLDLQGTVNEVAPGATVKIAELAAAGAKKGRLSWFAAIGKLVRSFASASAGKEGDLALGSRAADASSEGTGIDWELEETDAGVLIPEARKSIEAGSYAAALETLGKADAPQNNASLSWQLSFWKGYCYFQVEDYPDAVTHLSAAYALGTSAPSVPEDRAMLLFQLGSSFYLVGREKDAAPVLGAYVMEFPDGPFAAYARDLLAAIPK